MSWLFRSGTTDPAPTKEEPVQALPASWYTSPGMYSLEHRAIFSKRWLLITHSNRFVEVGEYVQYTEAGFPFFLIKDRQGGTRAYHNVCRHRACPVVEGGCGKVSIVACKYHNWSYGLDGKLAKAPEYQDLDGFDKSANGLFEIHVHVDKLGFIWVNFDAAETPEVPWDQDLDGIDEQPRLKGYDLSQYQLNHCWGMIGDYNWKTLADNYNECYHCPTGHPGIVQYTDLSKYWVETSGGHIQHWNTDKGEGLGVFSSFYYPNASITVSEPLFFIQRCVPVSATETKMEYEVYRNKNATDAAFNHTNDLFKVVMGEDKELCNAAQRNLETGVFMSGQLHPVAEKGPLYFQSKTRALVMAHCEQEKAAEKEIWPATPKHQVYVRDQSDVEFCASLDSKLEW